MIFKVMSSQSWWDPMTKLDTKFLQLIALMNPNSISGYPISSGNMKRLIDQAVNENNIPAAIGAFRLWTNKQQATINKENFKTIHLAWLDRCVFMLSSKDLKSEMENFLYWYFRVVIQNWCKSIDKKLLKSTEKQLQEAIGYMETGYKENQQKNRQIHQKIIKGILKMLHVQMNNKDTQEDFVYFQNKFSEHVKCILFHKRSIVFCTAIYEIFFTVIQQIYPIENGYNSNNSIGFIEKQLFFISNQQRLSISIEHMGFLLRKILKLVQKIPQKTLTEIMRLVYITIDRYQVVRINLVQKVQFFNFHMKKHNYFYYLEEIQKIKKYGQQDIINEWKMKIRNSIQMQQRYIKPTKDDIDQAIFFIQLRQKSKYLFDISRTDVWEFPDIQSNVVKRVMKTLYNTFIEFNGSGTRVGQYFTKRIKLNIEHSLGQYRQLNLLQKGVYVYYLHHHYISRLLVKNANPQEQIPTLKVFLSKLEPQQIIELFDFYLMEIQLGNLYNVPFKKNLYINDIAAYLYRCLAKQILQRILQFLSQQARIVMTKGMVYFLTFIKMYVIFETLLFKNSQQIKICRKCKIMMRSQNNYYCHNCQEILIGIKLNPKDQYYMVWEEQEVNKFKPLHTCKITQKIKALSKQNRTRMNNKSSEYSSMCNLLFEQALRNLNH